MAIQTCGNPNDPRMLTVYDVLKLGAVARNTPDRMIEQGGKVPGDSPNLSMI